MPASSPPDVIERIHGSGCGCVLSLTGGGSGAISQLLSVPGASATILEAIVPYAATALAEWLGGKFDRASSEPTARAMAMASFERARALSPIAELRTLRGIGSTASLVTTRPKRGPHRIHVAWQSAEATVSYSCELEKGRRTRAEEEELAAGLVLHAVAESCGVTGLGGFDSPADEPVARREKQAPPEWTELLAGQREGVSYRVEGAPRLIFSGAFNPLHAGHRQMIEIASRRAGVPVTLELSIANVDKPTLDFLEVDSRLGGLGGYPVVLTRAATFVAKAALFPGATFVVGADTIARIADEKYYDDDYHQRNSSLARIASLGCRFLVFGRAFEGRFQLPSQLNLPRQIRELCEEVDEREFRQDVSSTELRSEP